MSKPRALDLFCGAGGASMGLHRAGFDVTGIDIKRQPRYPFRFIQSDALRPPVRLEDFDLIWASPPCQAYSRGNPGFHHLHPDLMGAVRNLLQHHPLTVIENVVGAPMRVDLSLDGTMFLDLKVIRRRHFEMSFLGVFRLGFPAIGHVKYHGWSSPRRGGSLCGRDHRWLKSLGRQDTANHIENQKASMGVEWMRGREVANAIPPAYAEFIGREALRRMTETDSSTRCKLRGSPLPPRSA